MRVLILGGAGMLGHKLWQTLSGRMESYATLRRPLDAYRARSMFDAARMIDRFDATRDADFDRAFDIARPDVIVNAIGVIKQRDEAGDANQLDALNALLPHRLAERAARSGARLIQISTDCVFSGSRGNYRESDSPDPVDDYGRTKLRGELAGPRCLTLRTSMIGRELETSYGLLEWFLTQRGGSARGYRRAIFSGLTTQVLSGVIADIIEKQADLSGLWHVASEPIAKYELLSLIDRAFALGAKLTPDDSVVVNRSLDGSRFASRTTFRAPSWPEMIAALHADPTPYDSWR